MLLYLIQFITFLSVAISSTATSDDNTALRAADKREFVKPVPNYCIIVCTHAWCRALCVKPTYNGGSADNMDAAAAFSATKLLTAINAQPDKLGLPLTPGTDMVVLGQKDDGGMDKCAWFCSADTRSCEGRCWAAHEVQDAAVTDGGTLAGDEVVDGLTECRMRDKDEVGQVIVCIIPKVESGLSTGDGFGWNNMGCVLFWRARKPHLVCRKA